MSAFIPCQILCTRPCEVLQWRTGATASRARSRNKISTPRLQAAGGTIVCWRDASASIQQQRSFHFTYAVASSPEIQCAACW